jgi:UDP-GlcNAc:undecaprenyl-phosphate GlcNAc-1-phosphate transferase
VLVGFLRFNFNPATIFLGDSGSLWIGFVLACGAVEWSRSAITVPAAIAPLAALSIPLLDTGLSVARRFVTARPVFGADHGHIHHRLIDRGYTPRRVALVLYGVGVVAACSSLFLTVSSKSLGIVAVPLFFFAAVWIAVRSLGYQEFGILLRLLRSLRPAARSQLLLQSYENILRSAASPEACWQALRRLGLEFGFSHVALRLGNRYFEERLSPPRSDEWNLYLPLSGSEYLSLTRGSELSAEEGMAPLASLQRALSARALVFRGRPEEEERPIAVGAGAAPIRPVRPSLLRPATPPS